MKKLARFSVPGPASPATGEPRTCTAGSAYDHLHCVVDDHSRIAYAELHPRKDADTNVCTLERALAFFADLGLEPPEAVMTDNAMVDRHSRRFQALLADRRIRRIRRIRTPAYAALER